MKRNKVFFVLSFVFIFLFQSHTWSQDIFTDVPPDHWSRKSLEKLQEGGILESYPDNTFRGDQVVTRYEMAAALAKVLERVESIELLLGAGKTGSTGDDK